MCEGLRRGRQARKWKMTWPMATGVGVTLCDDLEGQCFYEIGTWNEGRPLGLLKSKIYHPIAFINLTIACNEWSI
jgi:hypothetical protein